MFIYNYLRKIKRIYLQKRILGYDTRKYIKFYSDSTHSYNGKAYFEREILVLCHMVEKGLSHEKIKPLFGYANVVKLSEHIEAYLKIGDVNDFIISLGICILQKYNEEMRILGVTEDKLVSIPNQEISALDVGTYAITKDEFFAHSGESFVQMSHDRRTVRLYDCQSNSIQYDVLKKSIAMASNCPNACNRQAVRVKVISNKDKIKKICTVQGGANGFGENAGALIVLTSDIRYYISQERRLPMFECGMFAMNLVYALQYHKLGTCILNGSFTEEQTKQLGKIINIPNYEMVATVIAVSDIPENACIRIAKSCRKEVDEIIQIL